MASDDMLVILYKILRYLDQCSKAGKSPRYEDMCYKSRLFNIQESRWTQVMEEAVRNGLVAGISSVQTKDGPLITIQPDARITLAGAEYLDQNASMKKIPGLLGPAFEILLGAIIKTI